MDTYCGICRHYKSHRCKLWEVKVPDPEDSQCESWQVTVEDWGHVD